MGIPGVQLSGVRVLSERLTDAISLVGCAKPKHGTPVLDKNLPYVVDPLYAIL